MLMRGRCRPSQDGIHQLALPSSVITAGHEQAAHEGCVDRDRHREPDAELLDHRISVEDEAREHADHDQAAEVITRPVFASPSITARVGRRDSL